MSPYQQEKAINGLLEPFRRIMQKNYCSYYGMHLIHLILLCLTVIKKKIPIWMLKQ